MKAPISIDRKKIIPVVYCVCIITVLCIKFKVFDTNSERVPPESSWYKLPQNTGSLDLMLSSKHDIK
jgi:hypothetical protein